MTKHKSNINYLVGVIIPVHRRIDLLQKCIDALPDAFGSIPYEVVIIDNDTPKEEKQEAYSALRAKGNIKIFEYKMNLGFPKACNFGASKSYAPLLFFLNSDVIMSPGSGVELVKKMDDPMVGVVGMRLVFPEFSDLNMSIRPGNKLQHIGLAINIQMRPVHMFVGWNPDHPKVMAMNKVPAVTGAALMVRRKLFVMAGKFFDGYGLGTFEDVDLCFSISELGYNICVEPKALGIHYTGATAEKYNLEYPFVANFMIFQQRWMKRLRYSDWELW